MYLNMMTSDLDPIMLNSVYLLIVSMLCVEVSKAMLSGMMLKQVSARIL